jgi:twitching motility protein PilT
VFDFDKTVRFAAKNRCSDIFLKPGVPPAVRVRGMVAQTEFDVLTNDDTEGLAKELMGDDAWAMFQEYHEKDIGFTYEDVTRLRINVYRERGNTALVLRLIPLEIYSIDQLGLPPVLKDICNRRQGFILVTGPTGCGKSTTLAAMIDLINRTRRCNIVTIEDPIEFVHPDKLSIVSQREVGIDTESFTDALKYVVRESPDVILIGEMRDVETMSVAMQASETGHLVFSTVHTTSAAETMERMINMFPPHDKPQICLRMSKSLVAVISQKLVPRADGTGRVCAVEVMVVTPTIAKIIEDGRPSEAYNVIADGEFWGMQTMNQSLLKHWKDGLITEEEALANAGAVTELRQMMRRA